MTTKTQTYTDRTYRVSIMYVDGTGETMYIDTISDNPVEAVIKRVEKNIQHCWMGELAMPEVAQMLIELVNAKHYA